MTADLNLAPIGNCAVTALIDAHGRMVWGCLPRVDSDPVFSNLLSGVEAGDPEARGVWAVEAARPGRVSSCSSSTSNPAAARSAPTTAGSA